MSALLEVNDLRVHFRSREGVVKAVDGISFRVDRGETLGVVGESGSGKSVTFMSCLGLIDRERAEISGDVRFEGRDLLKMRGAELRSVRGAGIGMVFQDPMTSLHPMYRVRDQLADAIRAHRGVSGSIAYREAAEMLARVGLPSPQNQGRVYPHELSGGMRQRVMIAMALVMNPALLVADEPTTALDVTVQAQILELFDQIRREFDIGIVLISHNLAVVADVCDRVQVMYAGTIVEAGTRDEVFGVPGHPYTWGLLESVPRTGERKRLISIEGSPPSLIRVPPGCPFNPRCAYVFEPCTVDRPRLEDRGLGHREACHLSSDEKRRMFAQREARRTEGAA